MKKSIIILLSVLAMAFTFSGCGGSEGSISSGVSGDTNGGANSGSNVYVEENIVVIDNGDPADTIPKTPYNLSEALGTPPGIPE